MAIEITWEDDLQPFAPELPEDKAEVMIGDALAIAVTVAPCLADTYVDDKVAAAAKAIIRGAILRWHDAASGVKTQQSVGPYQVTVDGTVRRNGMFWPSEIKDLQSLCRGNRRRKAFAIDTYGTDE